VTIGGSPAEFRNYLPSQAFISGSQVRRYFIIFVNFLSNLQIHEGAQRGRPMLLDWVDDFLFCAVGEKIALWAPSHCDHQYAQPLVA
jgi:hypothetical protein